MPVNLDDFTTHWFRSRHQGSFCIKELQVGTSDTTLPVSISSSRIFLCQGQKSWLLIARQPRRFDLVIKVLFVSSLQFGTGTSIFADKFRSRHRESFGFKRILRKSKSRSVIGFDLVIEGLLVSRGSSQYVHLLHGTRYVSISESRIFRFYKLRTISTINTSCGCFDLAIKVLLISRQNYQNHLNFAFDVFRSRNQGS